MAEVSTVSSKVGDIYEEIEFWHSLPEKYIIADLLGIVKQYNKTSRYEFMCQHIAYSISHAHYWSSEKCIKVLMEYRPYLNTEFNTETITDFVINKGEHFYTFNTRGLNAYINCVGSVIDHEKTECPQEILEKIESLTVLYKGKEKPNFLETRAIMYYLCISHIMDLLSPTEKVLLI